VRTLASLVDRIDLKTRLRVIHCLARVSLALVWIYEGLVPKILFVRAHPEQIALVRGSGIFWGTPEATLLGLGMAQMIAGLILLVGWMERVMAVTMTIAMFVLIVLVASGRPAMLTDPFGALIKDLCLVACAVAVVLLGDRRV
jgi:uncharacterized membrane protein YphA (DoxX/SURF4 family)